ncbi:MAG: hypothetical protein AB1796_12850 [Bacillota bacterium]
MSNTVVGARHASTAPEAEGSTRTVPMLPEGSTRTVPMLPDFEG